MFFVNLLLIPNTFLQVVKQDLAKKLVVMIFGQPKTTPNSPRRTVQIVENVRFGKLIKQKII